MCLHPDSIIHVNVPTMQILFLFCCPTSCPMSDKFCLSGNSYAIVNIAMFNKYQIIFSPCFVFLFKDIYILMQNHSMPIILQIFSLIILWSKHSSAYFLAFAPISTTLSGFSRKYIILSAIACGSLVFTKNPL